MLCKGSAELTSSATELALLLGLRKSKSKTRDTKAMEKSLLFADILCCFSLSLRRKALEMLCPGPKLFLPYCSLITEKANSICDCDYHSD